MTYKLSRNNNTFKVYQHTVWTHAQRQETLELILQKLNRTLLSQCEKEGRTLVWSVFGPHPPAVASDDPVHRSQTDAVSLDIRSGELLEGQKQLVRKSHVEARPVVPNPVDGFPVNSRHAEFYDRICLLASELPGVADQVIEHYS